MNELNKELIELQKTVNFLTQQRDMLINYIIDSLDPDYEPQVNLICDWHVYND